MSTRSFDLLRLLRDVFDPQPLETALVLVDVPHGNLRDSEQWADRRAMAAEWRAAFDRLGVTTLPLLSYEATGASNAELPKTGLMDGRTVELGTVLEKTNIAVAMSEFSATAPLVSYTLKLPHLRAASMPGVLRRMEKSALAAEHGIVAQKAQVLADLLTDATQAHAVFSTGHECVFDLRHRAGRADDGMCRRDKPDHRVINLPSGEAFIVPYEGERADLPSRTEGQIPVRRHDETAILSISSNRITGVSGGNKLTAYLEAHFAADPARRNVAELGLGCNDAAIVTGNVLEDEKAGFHWAYGRSEHLGGTVGPDAFTSPAHVLHHDIVYARGCPIGIAKLTLTFPNRETEVIIRDNEYCIF
jgi:leucyl aminopeptidase (aminopeptidase T)